jgi:hypothetical protein
MGWRARQLASTSFRRTLAGSIERVIAAAEGPEPLMSSAAPLNRREIRYCEPLLHALAGDLRGPEQVTPRGVALVKRLLRDGGSPIYGPEPDGALELALRRIRGALLLH